MLTKIGCTASSSSGIINTQANSAPITENSDLVACSFPNWYKNFEKISVPSICVHIPENVVHYLRDEIIILPKECYPNQNDAEWSSNTDDIIPSDSRYIIEPENENDIDSNSSIIGSDLEAPEFPEFSTKLTKTIEALGAAAFLKTNWRSPKDAFWITAGQTLKVKDIQDLYQLLKASSIVKEDLSVFNDNERYFVILKEWREIHPGTEFRCFVRNRNLIAISPRDWPQYHSHILTQRSNIVSDILTIFKEKIKNEFSLENFVFDVVRSSKDKVYLLDFSPLDETFTDPLAFGWDFLMDDSLLKPVGSEDDPEFRYLATDCGIQPNRRNNYGLPRDIVDFFKNSSKTSTGIAPTNLTDYLAGRVQDELQIQENEFS